MPPIFPQLLLCQSNVRDLSLRTADPSIPNNSSTRLPESIQTIRPITIPPSRMTEANGRVPSLSLSLSLSQSVCVCVCVCMPDCDAFPHRLTNS